MKKRREMTLKALGLSRRWPKIKTNSSPKQWKTLNSKQNNKQLNSKKKSKKKRKREQKKIRRKMKLKLRKRDWQRLRESLKPL